MIKAGEGWVTACIREWKAAGPYKEGSMRSFKVDAANRNAPFHIFCALRSKAISKSRTARDDLLKNKSGVKFGGLTWVRAAFHTHWSRGVPGGGCCIPMLHFSSTQKESLQGVAALPVWWGEANRSGRVSSTQMGESKQYLGVNWQYNPIYFPSTGCQLYDMSKPI